MLYSSHYLQSDEWASLRGAFGWSVLTVELPAGKVYMYKKATPLGGLLYVPGFMPRSKQDLETLKDYVKSLDGVLACKVEACHSFDPHVADWFVGNGWKEVDHVQYGHTVCLDLTQPEDKLRLSFKSRARQEIGYAQKAGVKIERVAASDKNLDVMFKILADTSQRKEFGIRDRAGMLKFWQSFRDADKLELFFAQLEGTVIAAGVFIHNGKTAWYKEGGSLPGHAKAYAPRLLLWEVARYFKAHGAHTFDLGGIPSPQTFESSPMRGIYVFKTAFAREVTTMMPVFELPLKRMAYPLWSALEPAAIKLNRRLRRR